MAETPYKNRELDEKFVNQASLIKEKHDDVMYKVNEVLVQTTKTNGRVSSLEKWRYLTMGAIGVLSFVVVPILGWALWVLVNINTTVHVAIDQALQAYDINK